MGRSQRQKGVRIERLVVNLLKEGGFPLAARNWSEQNEHICGRDISGIPGLCIQVKGGKLPLWKKGLKEAEEEVGRLSDPEIPVCVTRDDQGKTVVHLDLSDFLALL